MAHWNCSFSAAFSRRRAEQAEGRRRLPENDLNDGQRLGPGAQVPPPPPPPGFVRAGQQDGLPEPLNRVQPEPGSLHFRDASAGVDDLRDGVEQHRRRDPHRERERHCRQMTFHGEQLCTGGRSWHSSRQFLRAPCSNPFYNLFSVSFKISVAEIFYRNLCRF